MTLEVLTDDPIHAAICRDYWQMNQDGGFAQTISDIAKVHKKTSAEVTKIVKEHCVFSSTQLFCESCADAYSFEGRADYSAKVTNEKWTCKQCRSDLVQAELDNKYSCVLRHAETSLSKPIDLHDICARHMVALVGVSRFGADETLSHIQAFNTIHDLDLTPSTEYSVSLIKELYSSNLLIVSPNSNLDRVSLNENGGYSFYITEVEFLLPNQNPSAFISLIEEEIVSDSFIDEHRLELQNFAHEIALHECLAYLQRALSEHQLQYSPGEKTLMVLNKGLQSYSVSQMYSFIWRAAKDAAAFYARKRVSRDHAAKTVVGSIESQIERALANEWDVTAYRRNYDHPQSVLSRTLFNTVLKTDDGGFTKKISSLFQVLE
jgi:hypothetical protein